jgi:hypothetical protein
MKGQIMGIVLILQMSHLITVWEEGSIEDLFWC